MKSHSVDMPLQILIYYFTYLFYYLEHDVSAHCFAVCYDRFITRAIPAVKFNAPNLKQYGNPLYLYHTSVNASSAIIP